MITRVLESVVELYYLKQNENSFIQRVEVRMVKVMYPRGGRVFSGSLDER